MGQTEIEAHLLSNVYLLRNNDHLSVYAYWPDLKVYLLRNNRFVGTV
jgi:hypothetical protein